MSDGAGPGASSPPAKGTEFRGSLLAIAATSCFAVSFAVIKHLTVDLPEPVIAMFRSVFAALFFVPIVARYGIGYFATNRPIGHAWRSAFGFASFLIFVYALRLLPLGDAVALSFTTPFWSLLLGAVVLRERITWRLSVAVAVGFVGVWLIARPSGQTMVGTGAAIALTSAVFTSLAMMTVKQLTKTEPPDRIAFYFTVFGTAISVIPACFDWQFPAPHHWLGLVAVGALFSIGQICLTRAYAYSSLSRIAPLDFVRLPIAVILGIVAFGEIPAASTVAGMALILLAALDLLWFGLRRSR